MEIGRYMEISMYLNMCGAGRYMETTYPLHVRVVQEGTWKFPCALACVVQVFLYTCVTFGRNSAF